jgi:hypothetical protein
MRAAPSGYGCFLPAMDVLHGQGMQDIHAAGFIPYTPK